MRRWLYLGFFETYNILEAPPLSMFSRMRYLTQNIRFHLANVMMLDGRQKITFLSEKGREAKRRIVAELGSRVSRAARALGFNGITMPHVQLTQVNDLAPAQYEPQPYSGPMTLFRPKRPFAGWEDPHFGWSKLIRSGPDVHVLPVYPRGMLVEPLVELLATELEECLNKAHDECDATAADDRSTLQAL